MKPIIVVQGGQYGSEGKGMIAAYLCESRGVDFAVRTGAVNAGHTVMYRGAAYKMQQLPTGWINPGTKLVIGAGAYINAGILDREIQMIANAMDVPVQAVLDRLFIDYRAGIHRELHTERSTASGRHHGIGATGKGCSEAILDKVRNRGRENGWFSKDLNSHGYEYDFIDTEMLLNEEYNLGRQILIEGTQGDGLDLHLGPYPYTTHKQTTVANWLSECGLSPKLQYEVVLVMRTYPIRVVGNSGPMQHEINWLELARTINWKRANKGMSAIVAPHALEEYSTVCDEIAGQFSLDRYDFENWGASRREQYKMQVSEFHKVVLNTVSDACRSELEKLFEMTTVTRKLRRVAEFDFHQAAVAIRRSRPDSIALTFLNYIHPELWHEAMLSLDAKKYIHLLERELKVPISLTTLGPDSQHVIEVRYER